MKIPGKVLRQIFDVQFFFVLMNSFRWVAFGYTYTHANIHTEL